jgi:hypothetical protein
LFSESTFPLSSAFCTPVLLTRLNIQTFGELCAAYIKDGLPFRKKDGRQKAKGTIETYEYHIHNHILLRWKDRRRRRDETRCHSQLAH